MLNTFANLNEKEKLKPIYSETLNPGKQVGNPNPPSFVLWLILVLSRVEVADCSVKSMK